MATNLHAVFSSDCTKCILQLHHKINTVKKKNTLQIFPQWIYQETEKHMKALGLLKALCI